MHSAARVLPQWATGGLRSKRGLRATGGLRSNRGLRATGVLPQCFHGASTVAHDVRLLGRQFERAQALAQVHAQLVCPASVRAHLEKGDAAAGRYGLVDVVALACLDTGCGST